MPNTHPILKDGSTISDIQKYIAAVVVYRGFTNTVHDDFLMLTEEVGELAKTLRKAKGIGIAKDSSTISAEDEVADVLWMLICVCNQLGINLEHALRQKEEKNKRRTWQ